MRSNSSNAVAANVRSEPERARYTVDELAQLDIDALSRIYQDARPIESLQALAGAPAGRMLTVIGPLGSEGLRGRVARLARASFFPWRGKSFRAFSPERGEGINRVRILGDRFRFELLHGQSAIDGGPAVILDYDLPENPWFIRMIHDELREVGDGVFLGPAMLKRGAKRTLVLFFAIDTNVGG